MNYRLIGKYTGNILLVEGIFLLPAIAVAMAYREPQSARAIAIAALITLLPGILLSCIRVHRSISMSEGFVVCALGWIVLSLFGALPFYISGEIPRYIDCWFETVSGFTTTGSSILTNVEAMSHGLLYWRSFTHWIGGMGVLVFLLAILPLAKGDGGPLQLMKAESPGPSVGKLVPKISTTAKITYIIYFAMTVLMVIILLFEGMPLFDAVMNTFGTAGTGGFAIKNNSIAAYPSQLVQMTIGVFMALFGVNFSVYYLMLTRKWKDVLHNEEFRWYWIIMLGASLLIAINVFRGFYPGDFGQAFRDSFFSVSSVMTTTGYCTADFDKWPEFSRYMLLLVMCIGASAGSTGGGLKVSRVLLLFKHLRLQMCQMIHPRRVRSVRMDKRRVDNTVMLGTTAFLAAYLCILIVSVVLVSLDGKSFETTFSAVICTFNNIGPGLGMVGPTGNFSAFSDFSKFVLSADMLFGCLEIFPLLFLLSPEVWMTKRLSTPIVSD